MISSDTQEHLIANMRRWQRVEDNACEQMDEIIAKAKNPLVKMVMEIIRTDSATHRRVQQVIINTLANPSNGVSPYEFVEVWDLIDRHIKSEKGVQALARESLQAVRGNNLAVQEFLLNYLLEDETKHDRLLESLQILKKGVRLQ